MQNVKTSPEIINHTDATQMHFFTNVEFGPQAAVLAPGVRLNNVTLGAGTRLVGPFINMYGCAVGAESKIGGQVEVQSDVTIGERCKISSHTFICSGIRIGNGVFIGHGVMFTNDRHPRAVRSDGELEAADDWKDRFQKTIIEDEVSIGSNATILCGLTIGKGALIGAGAVVTKDVSPGATVVGNPARPLTQ